MKIKLEAGEIAAILKDWAKAKYRTHNINCDFHITKDNVEVELELVMPEHTIADAGPTAIMEELLKAQIGLPKRSQTMLEPDLTPNFSGNTDNL